MTLKVYIRLAYPYGAPYVHVRGGATKVPEFQQFLRENGLRWDSSLHCWKGVNFNSATNDDLDKDIIAMSEAMGFEVIKGGAYEF
jgi:hypothetical protein